jgi:hypothetical protein
MHAHVSDFLSSASTPVKCQPERSVVFSFTTPGRYCRYLVLTRTHQAHGCVNKEAAYVNNVSPTAPKKRKLSNSSSALSSGSYSTGMFSGMQ